MTRDHDVVLFGATGFTGALTAEYLAAQGPSRWALAGRNEAKLTALRDRLGVDVPILIADSTDRASLRRIAESTKVIASTVGPYVLHGEPLVAACAETGTDYVDLTGESEFVDRMFVAHHKIAQRSGARLVHACGFDSIPHDLGVQFTVAQLPADQPITVRGYLSAGGTASGGTFATVLTGLSRVRQAKQAAAARRAVEPRHPIEPRHFGGPGPANGPAGGRRARIVPGRLGFDQAVRRWVLPLPTIDPQIVVRSAHALETYGPDFRYTHLATLGSPIMAGLLVAGLAGAFVLAQTPPTRALLGRLRPPGAGPDAEKRAKSWFSMRFIATAGDQRVVTEVSGGDPGYTETAKMLAESALCLATDDLPASAGQVTTAVAMGDALRARLERAGMVFRVVSTTD